MYPQISYTHGLLDILSFCFQVPGTATPKSHLPENEIEIGMGIHNEAGNKRLSPVPPTDQLIDQLITMIVSTEDKDRSFVPFLGGNKDRVVALVNNLGGLSELEIGSISGEVARQLKSRGLTVERLISGTFMVRLRASFGNPRTEGRL